MRRRSLLGVGALTIVALASACIGDPGSEGTAGETTPSKDAGDRDASSSSLVDSATSTADSAVGDSAGIDSATTDGAATIDAGPPWKLYSNSTVTATTTWNVVNLDVAWSGANAPPPRGIKAVCQLNDFPRLLVWADNGMFYVRDPSGWRTPVATATLFPALAGRDFRGCGHQPSVPGTAPADRVESLAFVDNPTAILYNWTAADAVQYALTVTMTDESGPYGAPKASKKTRWMLRIWTPSQYGTAAYLADYSGFDNDPNVYLFDATPAPAGKWAFADAPLFKSKTNGPAQQDIMAAYRDDTLGINFMITR